MENGRQPYSKASSSEGVPVAASKEKEIFLIAIQSPKSNGSPQISLFFQLFGDLFDNIVSSHDVLPSFQIIKSSVSPSFRSYRALEQKRRLFFKGTLFRQNRFKSAVNHFFCFFEERVVKLRSVADTHHRFFLKSDVLTYLLRLDNDL